MKIPNLCLHLSNDPQAAIKGRFVDAGPTTSWVSLDLEMISIFLSFAQFHELRSLVNTIHESLPIEHRHEPSAEELAENAPQPVAPILAAPVTDEPAGILHLAEDITRAAAAAPYVTDIEIGCSPILAILSDGTKRPASQEEIAERVWF